MRVGQKVVDLADEMVDTTVDSWGDSRAVCLVGYSGDH